jgi:hypothetical protein
MRIVLATFPSPSPSLSLSLSLPLPLLSCACVSARTIARVRADPRTQRGPPSPSPSPLISLFLSYLQGASGRTRASVRADPWTHPRPRLYNPHPHLIFLLFLSLPLVGVVGFAWQHPFRLAKGEGVTSILRGIPLHFLQSKNSRIVYILLMLVYSVMQVFM